MEETEWRAYAPRTYGPRRRSSAGLILLLLIGLTAVALFNLTHRSHQEFVLAAGKPLDGPEIELLEKQNKAFERIIDATAPSIVYVRTEQVFFYVGAAPNRFVVRARRVSTRPRA